MTSLNRITLIGNLGKDPVVEKGDTSYANLSLATHVSWKDKNGEFQQLTEWHSIKVFSDHLLERVVPKLQKGDLVMVEGSLRTRKWIDKQGNPHHTSEVVLGSHQSKIMLLKSCNADDKNFIEG